MFSFRKTPPAEQSFIDIEIDVERPTKDVPENNQDEFGDSFSWQTIDWISNQPINCIASKYGDIVVEADFSLKLLRLYLNRRPEPFVWSAIDPDETLNKQVGSLLREVLSDQRLRLAKPQHPQPPTSFVEEYGFEWFLRNGPAREMSNFVRHTYFCRSNKNNNYFVLSAGSKIISLYFERQDLHDLKFKRYDAVCTSIDLAWPTMVELLEKANTEHQNDLDWPPIAPGVTLEALKASWNTPVADPADGHLPISNDHPMLSNWETWIESDAGRAAQEHMKNADTQRAALYLAWSESWRMQQQLANKI